MRDISNGYLGSGGNKPVGKEDGSFDFEIAVRPTKGLRFVHGVIFLSPTGSWNDHTFAATTGLIPVADGHVGKEPKLVRWPVRQLLEHGGRRNAPPTAMLRWMNAFLLLAASAVAWVTFRSIASGGEAPSREPRWGQVFAMALMLACLWELCGLENWLGTRVRAWAHAEDVYYSRVLFQKGIISVTIAATFVFLGFGWRQRRPYRFALLFFSMYLAISVVNLLSLHSIDRYAGLYWHGISLVEALKLVCAMGTLISVCRARQCSGTARIQAGTPRA